MSILETAKLLFNPETFKIANTLKDIAEAVPELGKAHSQLDVADKTHLAAYHAELKQTVDGVESLFSLAKPFAPATATEAEVVDWALSLVALARQSKLLFT